MKIQKYIILIFPIYRCWIILGYCLLWQFYSTLRKYRREKINEMQVSTWSEKRKFKVPNEWPMEEMTTRSWAGYPGSRSLAFQAIKLVAWLTAISSFDVFITGLLVLEGEHAQSRMRKTKNKQTNLFPAKIPCPAPNAHLFRGGGRLL